VTQDRPKGSVEVFLAGAGELGGDRRLRHKRLFFEFPRQLLIDLAKVLRQQTSSPVVTPSISFLLPPIPYR
jgi:hypothetical protein